MLTTATFAKTGLKNKIVQLQPAQYCMWCTSVQKDYLFEMEKQHSKFTYLGVFYKPINWRIYAHYYERLSDTYVHTIQRTFFVDWRVMGCSISHVMSAYEHIAEIHAISMHTCMWPQKVCIREGPSVDPPFHPLPTSLIHGIPSITLHPPWSVTLSPYICTLLAYIAPHYIAQRSE